MHVHWHEGLFLQPHHLQLMQRQVQVDIRAARAALQPYCYGVIESRLSNDDLADGRIRFERLRAIMPTAAKMAWIRAESAAGVREIEVGSFVPARLLPQLADTDALVRYARTISGLTVAVLVPNLHGARAAIAAGDTDLDLVVSPKGSLGGSFFADLPWIIVLLLALGPAVVLAQGNYEIQVYGADTVRRRHSQC